jgi:hypothetical protein
MHTTQAPLLLAQRVVDLPPLAVFGSITKETAAAPLPTTVPEIGMAGWPSVSAFDNTHLGLVLAWIDAPTPTQLRVFEAMQHVIDEPPPPTPTPMPNTPDTNASPTSTTTPAAAEAHAIPPHILPRESAAAECCRLAAAALRTRGGPWATEDWDVGNLQHLHGPSALYRI